MAEIKKINGYLIKDETARNSIAHLGDVTTDLKTMIDSNGEEISKIINGPSKVNSAKTADSATVATKFMDEVNGPISIYEEFHDVKSSAASAYNLANDAKVIAEGRAKAVSFDTLSAMTTALKSAAKSAYKVGDNLFIKATDVPDYWVSGVLDTNTGTYGYFVIDPLETQKVDLSEYAKTAKLEDGTIKPKNAVNAENAGWATWSQNTMNYDESEGSIKNKFDSIENGNTIVGEAKDYASTGTIKSKFDALDKKNIKFAYNAGTEELTISFS